MNLKDKMYRRFSCSFFVVGGLLCTSYAQDIDDVILPNKTEVFVQLQRSLNSKTVKPGDRFSAVVEVPVTLNDRIVIPVGTYVLGHVQQKETAGYLKGKASLLLAFDSLILPGGKTRLMRAAVESAEGYPTNPNREDGELRPEGSQAEEVAAGAATGAVTGMITGVTIGALWRGSSVGRSTAIGTGVGAAGGALLGLLKKGEEVELPKGASLTIQLQEPILFVKPPPHPTGQPLTP